MHQDFETRADAVAWGRIVESEIERGVFVNREEAERPRWLTCLHVTCETCRQQSAVAQATRAG